MRQKQQSKTNCFSKSEKVDPIIFVHDILSLKKYAIFQVKKHERF